MPTEKLRAAWADVVAVADSPERRRLTAEIRSRHPRFVEAVVADARMAAKNRGERADYRSSLDTLVQVVRLAFVTDAFLGQICYRAKAATQARGIPFVPRLLHRLAMRWGQILIGDPVVVAAGVFFPHGHVVIDGITELEARVMVGPFSTIGLVAGEFNGPVLRLGVKIGTGTRVLGPVEIGQHTEVGANAVVVRDLPANVVAVGSPAKVVRDKSAPAPTPPGGADE